MTIQQPSSPSPSAIRRTFFRGIYEIFSYLLPGILVLYLLYVMFSLATRGWNEYLGILFTAPEILQGNLMGVLVVIAMAYLSGHLSWPLRWISRKIWYRSSPTRDRVYSSINKYFDMTYNGQALSAVLINRMEEFTDIDNILLLTDEGISRERYSGGLFPQSEITVDSGTGGKDFRRSYRIIERFIEYSYPGFYHRGYERYQGLRRFWENIFTISMAFAVLSGAAVLYNGFHTPLILLFVIPVLTSITAVYRLRELLLSPYREVLLLFYLHTEGKL